MEGLKEKFFSLLQEIQILFFTDFTPEELRIVTLVSNYFNDLAKVDYLWAKFAISWDAQEINDQTKKECLDLNPLVGIYIYN
jgi:hypothetical protein